MRITCPECKKAYKIPDEAMRPEGVKVRCSACETRFVARGRQAMSAAGADETPPDTGTDTNTQTGYGVPDVGNDHLDVDSFFAADDESGASSDPAPDAGEASLDAFFGNDAADAGQDDDVEASGSGSDDLFGAADDLFDQPHAPPDTAGPDPDADVDDLFGPAEEDDAGHEALSDLFGDDSADQPEPSEAAAPATQDEDDTPETVIGFDKEDIPDFDWDENDDDDAAAPAAPSDATAASRPSAKPTFRPALGVLEAQRVLEDTIVRERPPTRRRRRLFPLVTLLLLSVGLGATYWWQPALIDAYVGRLLKPLMSTPSVDNQAVSIVRSPVEVVDGPRMRTVENRRGFSVLVVEGVLENRDDVPHSFIEVGVSLHDKAENTPVTRTTVYAGNRLNALQLKTFPPREMESSLNVEMGDSLSNFNVAPQARVPFMAVFVPRPAQPLDRLRVNARAVRSHRGDRS